MQTTINNHLYVVNRFFSTFLIPALLLLLVLSSGANGAANYRPEKAKRTLNTDRYALSIQRDNLVDIHSINDLPIMLNACPTVTYVDQEPRRLKVTYQQSERVSINTPLGKGNGLRFQSDECEWLVATYPGQPFITVDLTFTNDSKKPVQVQALSPWSLNEDRDGAAYVELGPSGVLRVLSNPPEGGSFPQIATGSTTSVGHLAALAPETREGLLCGFLTQQRALQTLALEPQSGKNGLYSLTATCGDAAPVEVAPGETLRADTLYVSVQELDLADGLRRYAQAARRLENYPALPKNVQHGWAVTGDEATNETAIRRVMDDVSGEGRDFGWTHVHLGTAWMNDATTLTVDTEDFPQGLEPLARYAHERGLTLGITVPTGLTTPDALATFIATGNQWGVDSIEMDYGPSTMAPGDIYSALRDRNYPGPLPVYVRQPETTPSPLSAWAEASRQYYLPPTGSPRLDTQHTTPGQWDGKLSDSQFATAFSLAALQGSYLRPTTPFSDQSTLRKQILGRLIPGLDVAAHPIDLFGDAPPQQWHLPLKTNAGTWNILGIFNWDETQAKTFRTPLTDFSLNPGVRYTVYDFWAGRYLGIIKDTLQLEVPPSGVRILGLRFAERRPMFVATNRDYTQGASDHEEIAWSHDKQQLSGRMSATKGFPYALSFYIPEPYRLTTATCSVDGSKSVVEGESTLLTFTPTETGEVTWSLQF